MSTSSSESGIASYVSRTAIWIPVAVITLLMSPMALTKRTFGQDWTLHLWAIRQQQWNIEAMGRPGLFVSARPLGAFYPLFAFVGSGIYSVGGYLAFAVGPIFAYKLLFLLGLCLAYGGFTWLSLQFGLRDWRAQVPGAVLVTAAYFLTDMVGRGDFGEFIAVASIPFVVAAICAFLRGPQRRLGYRVSVVLGIFVLTGSHNITLLWGTVFVAVLLIVAVVAWAPTWPRPLPWKRLGQLVALAAIGAGLNAWYLFPDLAYGLDTEIARQSRAELPLSRHVQLGRALNPLRPFDPVAPFFRLSFPVLFFVWALVVATVFWRRADWSARRLLIALVVVAVAFAELVLVRASWKWLPHVFYNVQFTYRLTAYVILATSLLVLIALAWQAEARDPSKGWISVALIAVVVFNVGAATWQVWSARSYYVSRGVPIATGGAFAGRVVRAHYVIPPSWYNVDAFRDVSSRVVAVGAGRTMTLPLNRVHGSSFAGTIDVPDGPAPFATNVVAGPRFVRMTGIRAVGRTIEGFVVAVRADRAPAAGPVAITVRPAESSTLRTGELASLISVLALAALIVWPLRTRMRVRGAPRIATDT